MCNLCVIWHYQPYDMHIHFHMINLIDMTELGTAVTFYIVPNRCRFHWSISRWILLCRKHFRKKSFEVELKFTCAELQLFSTLSKYHIIILVSITHRNRSPTSYDTNVFHAWNVRELVIVITSQINLNAVTITICANKEPTKYFKFDSIQFNIPFSRKGAQSKYVISVYLCI